MANVTVKNLKQEDAVRSFGEELMEFLELYWRRLAIAALALVVLLLVFWMNKQATAAREADASRQLTDLEQSVRSALSRTDPQETDKALDVAIEQCKEAAKDLAGTPAGREAVYLEGYSQHLRGNNADAVAAFEQYLGQVTTDEEKAKAQNALGYVYEDQLFEKPQDAELAKQAREAYEAGMKLGRDASGQLNVYGRQAGMGLGRVAEIAGDYAQAKTAYETVAAAPSPLSDDAATSASQTQGQRSREERADAIRKALRDIDTEYSYKRLAEQRLDLLKAREETATPNVHGTH